MFFIFIWAQVYSYNEDDYQPDIKVGILKKAGDRCKIVINENTLVYAHVEVRIADQPLPIISTYKTGDPIYFKMSSSNIIPGFKKALLGACKGEIRRVTIPPNLAYESESVDGLFLPYSTFIATVEIVEILDSTTRSL